MITQVLGYNSWSSRLFTLTFVLTFLLWIITAMKAVNAGDLLVLFISLFAFIHVFLNAWRNGGELNFSYLRKYIMFVTSLFFLQAVSKIGLTEQEEKRIERGITFLSVFLAAGYFVFGRKLYVINGITTNYLTFRFTNPNLTALFLSCIAYMEFCMILKNRKVYGKILHLLLFAGLALFIKETRSRNALIILAVFLVFAVLLSLKRAGAIRVPKAVSVLVSIFPILFVVAYLGFSSNYGLKRRLAFLVSEGKGLDSRMSIWRPALSRFHRSPIVGAYYEISGGSGMSQLHNTHLDILASYGVWILILICILLFYWLHTYGRQRRDKLQMLYYLGFVCVLLLGIGEAALFSGGLGIYILAGMYLLYLKPSTAV